MKYNKSVMEITLFAEMDTFVAAELDGSGGKVDPGEVGGGSTPDD